MALRSASFHWTTRVFRPNSLHRKRRRKRAVSPPISIAAEPIGPRWCCWMIKMIDTSVSSAIRGRRWSRPTCSRFGVSKETTPLVQLNLDRVWVFILIKEVVLLKGRLWNLEIGVRFCTTEERTLRTRNLSVRERVSVVKIGLHVPVPFIRKSQVKLIIIILLIQVESGNRLNGTSTYKTAIWFSPRDWWNKIDWEISFAIVPSRIFCPEILLWKLEKMKCSKWTYFICKCRDTIHCWCFSVWVGWRVFSVFS